MKFIDILKSLYAINGMAAILFYVPQIRSACKNKSPMRSVSLVTFGGWSFGGAVTVLYAWLFAHDPMFVAASFGGMTGAVSMFCIVVSKRLTYRHISDKAPIEGPRASSRGGHAGSLTGERPRAVAAPHPRRPLLAFRRRKNRDTSLSPLPRACLELLTNN